MKLKPENYEIEEVELKDICVEKFANAEYLQIRLWFDSCSQGYPACKINDLSAGIDSLKDCFGVSSIEEINGKKCLAILSRNDVFALVNPVNNKLFSLQAQFFPEQYRENINEFKSQKGNEFLHRLSDQEALLVGFMNDIKPKNEKLAQHVQKIVNSYSMAGILEEDLPLKSENSKRKNKI